MNIKPLCAQSLSQAQALVKKTFKPSHNELLTLKASLSPEEHKEWHHQMQIAWLNYWVMHCHESSRVTGTVGLYEEVGDEQTLWLGWYCVDPDFRGQALGSKLLDFAITIARRSDKNSLMLYTDRDDAYRNARLLYEKRGFRLLPPDPAEPLFYRLYL